MSTFVLVSSASDHLVKRLTRAADSAGSSLRMREASRAALNGAEMVSFARENGSGGNIAHDLLGRALLVSAGTWFHADCTGPDAQEKLLERYLRVGARQLGRELDGCFAIAVFDARTDEVVVLTDALGRMHCFVRDVGDGVVVSTSSLLLASLGPSTLDEIAVHEFLNTGIIHGDRTLHREVRKLGPATVTRWPRAGAASSSAYWSPAEIAVDGIRDREAADRLLDSLQCTVKTIERRFPRVLADLTGGYDSRALTCALRSAGVAFDTTVSGPPTSPDVVTACRVAVAAKLKLSVVPFEPSVTFDEMRECLPLTDGAYDLVEYSQIRRAHQRHLSGYDVSLNGSAGEIARGRWWEHAWLQRPDAIADRIVQKRFLPATQTHLVSGLSRDALKSELLRIAGETTAPIADLPVTAKIHWLYLSMRMQSWQGRIATSTDRLWPCLSPFLFRGVIETMMSLSTRARRRSLVVRKMIWKNQPAMASVPMNAGYPPVPATLRTAHAFRMLPAYYLRRASRRFGPAVPTEAPRRDTPQRMTLWLDPRVERLLDPARMSLARIADPEALERFLAGSRRDDFAADDVWRRALTIECAEAWRAEAGLSSGKAPEITGSVP